MLRRLPMLAVVIALAAAGGCTVIQTGDAITSKSLLRAAQASSDAVRVDIYWADLPTDSEDLWSSIEETRLPADLRRRLASNGLRAGVVGGSLPDGLLALLDPTGQAAADVDEEDPTEPDAGELSLDETGVSRATYTLAPGRRVDLQAGPTTASAPLLVARDGELSGRTFDQVQPTYVLELLDAEQGASRGGARVRLAPELRHGDQRLRFTPDTNGAISRASMTRDVEPFPELAIGAELAPGETLVVTSTPSADGRLGGYFHQAAEDSARRRAMLIRVAATPRENAFDVD